VVGETHFKKREKKIVRAKIFNLYKFQMWLGVWLFLCLALSHDSLYSGLWTCWPHTLYMYIQILSRSIFIIDHWPPTHRQRDGRWSWCWCFRFNQVLTDIFQSFSPPFTAALSHFAFQFCCWLRERKALTKSNRWFLLKHFHQKIGTFASHLSFH
jgi:hypothetical protein